MKKTNINPLIFGIISVVSPIPMMVFTVLWSWVLFFGIGMGLLGYDTIPGWILVLSILPMGISPAFSLFGIVYGIVKRKERYSILCILLSALGVLINAALICGILYLGATY